MGIIRVRKFASGVLALFCAESFILQRSIKTISINKFNVLPYTIKALCGPTF